MDYSITYNRQNKDYDLHFGTEYHGSFTNHLAAETEARSYIYNQLQHAAPVEYAPEVPVCRLCDGPGDAARGDVFLCDTCASAEIPSCDICDEVAVSVYGDGYLCTAHYDEALLIEREEVEMWPPCPACSGGHYIQQCPSIRELIADFDLVTA